MLKIFKIINSKIRNKLIFGFIFISLFVSVVSYICFNTIWQIEKDYDHISTSSIPIIQHLEDMKFASLQLTSSASEFAYIQTESKEKLEISPLDQENNPIQQSCKSCHYAFAQFEQLVTETHSDLIESSIEIRDIGNKVHIDALEFIEMKKQNISGTRALKKLEKMEISKMNFLKVVDHAMDHTNNKLEEEKAHLVSTISLSLRNIIVFSGLTFFLSVLIGILYSRSISKPITKLIQITNDFRKGNLDAKINVKSIDEIGILANAFNNMAHALKTSTAKLQMEKYRFQQLYENAPIGIALLTKDDRIIQINKTFQSIFNYTVEEIKGKKLDELIVPSEYFGEAAALLTDALQNGISDKETIRKRKDGSLINVHAYGVPIIIEGDIAGLYKLYEDITLRKQSEEALRFQNEIMTNMTEALYVVRLEDNVIVYTNSNFEQMFCYEKNELLGKHFSIINAPTEKRPEETAEEIKDSILENNFWQGEVNNIKKDRTPFWCYANVSVFDHSTFGKVFVSFHTDITERKRAELEQQVLFDIMQGITTTSNLDELLNLMYCSLKKVIYADNCFVALHDTKTGLFSFPLFVDQFDSTPEPVTLHKSCSSYIFRTNKPLLLSQELFDRLVGQNEVELIGTNSPSWIGVPLQTPSRTIGVLVLQHYEKENVYDEHDIRFLESIGNQVAIIIERKQAEVALRESEIKLKVILESTADGILAVDSKGKIIKTNKRFAELWQIPKFLIDSSDESDLLNFVLDQLDDPEEFKSKVKKLYNSTFEDSDIINFKDGRIFERFSTPLLMHDSSLGRVWSFRDITDRIRSEETLRESEDRFRNLVENISDVFFIANEDGKLSYCSPNFYTQTNFLPQDIIGKSYIRFVIPEDRKRIIEFYAEQIKSNVLDAKVDFRAVRKCGTFMWVEQNTRFVRDNNGKVIQYRIVVRDITERKRWEEEVKKHNEQLSKVNAEKDKFFSIIAHDLKSPFLGLLGLSEILTTEDEEFTKEELLEFGKGIHESTSTLFKLIENLLEWAQMQRGSISITPKELDLSAITLKNIEIINQRATQKGIKIINEVLETQKVFADEKMVDSIIRNLLSNAIKFTKQEGKVVIRSKKISNELVEISISDTGVGMSEENIKKLFKIEEKVCSIGTDGESSTGLGLLLCKEFVEKNGGTIWVKSREGKGSTFSFSLKDVN